MNKTQEALKLALVAFECDASNENFLILKHCVREALADQPASKPWVGLTDAEIQKEFHPLHATGLQFARSIEAKLKEKNT